MEEKNLDKIVDEMIEKAIPTIKANMVDDSAEAPEVNFSGKHNQKMQEIFALAKKMEEDFDGNYAEYEEMLKSYENKKCNDENSEDVDANDNIINIKDVNNKSKNHSRRGNRKKFFTILVAATLVLGIIGVAGANKLDLVETTYDDKEEYSEINNNNFVSSEIQIGNVVFTYIPKGFLHKNINDTKTNNRFLFENETKYFEFEIKRNKWNSRVNTEDSNVEEIVLGNKVVVCSLKDGFVNVTWKQDNLTSYVLFGNCEKHTMLNIAKGIKILEEMSQSGE